MALAEGRVFEYTKDLSEIGTQYLETFNYEGERQRILIETNEFSAVCPFSGLPDIAYVRITYIPKDRIIELKSLKYYFVSFRRIGIAQETVTKTIYKHLQEMLHPEALHVVTRYQTRGGIDVTCDVGKPIQEVSIGDEAQEDPK